MKKIILLLALIIPIMASAQIKFQEITLQEAMKIAAKGDKAILVDVISGRVDDKSLQKVFGNKEFEKNITDAFLPIRIDLMKSENEYFIKYVDNIPYPCAIFLSAKGERLTYGFWDEMAMGSQNANSVYKKAIDADATKKLNTRKLNFRDISYEEAMALAKKENKPVFIFCSMNGCGPCKQMENDVFTINQIADGHNKNFICIKSKKETDDVAQKYGVRGFPGIIYLSPDGTVRVKEEGFKTVQQLLGYASKTMSGDEQTERKSVPMVDSFAATASGSSAASTTVGSSSAAASSSSAAAASSSAASSSSSAAASSSSSAAATLQDAEVVNNGSKINFEKLTLEQAKAKAAKENKVIYVDISATWCGPCQQMKKTTFVDNTVVEYMNKNFINICFECDIDEEMSSEYREKYQTSAFPSHLLIDSNGELVHKFVGFHPTQSFMQELQRAIGGEKGLGYYVQKYKAGERSPEFMGEYITLLANANEGKAASELASGYLNTLPLEALTTPQNFMLVYEFARDIDSELAQKVLNNKAKFEKAVGEQDIDIYTKVLWTIKVDSYIKEVDGKKVFDEAGYKACIKRMEASNYPRAEEVKLESGIRNAVTMSNWESFLKITSNYMKKSGGKANLMLTCNWGLDLAKACSDKNILKEYAKVVGENYEQVKKQSSEEALVWQESFEYLMKDLAK